MASVGGSGVVSARAVGGPKLVCVEDKGLSSVETRPDAGKAFAAVGEAALAVEACCSERTRA